MNTNSIQSKRVLSLDVFRGLTIVLMILVNSPGNRSPYPILEHATWNGCTLADLVFPSFLFIVGLTSVIHLKSQLGLNKQDKGLLYAAILRRSVILFALGLFINVFPHPIDVNTVRIYGILQRIALCYLISSVIYLNTSIKTQILIFIGILLGYWLMMTLIPVPGFGANNLTEHGSWVAYFDQLLFSAPHLYGTVYDPEGAFSTLPSLATTLAGVLTGNLLISALSQYKKFIYMLFAGIISLGLGWIWSFSFPINKDLWTSSFVLLTSGYALVVFAFCYWVIDILGYKKWALPFKIFGMNALFAFIFHIVLIKIQAQFVFVLKNGSIGSLKMMITEYLFEGFTAQNASLLFSFSFLLLNFLVVAFLYRRKLFIRI